MFIGYFLKARKQIQRILMTLDSLGVPFRSIDITIQENWDEREFMRQNAINPRCGSEVAPIIKFQ